MRIAIAFGILLTFASVSAAQTNPCDTNASGPFVVTSAKAFTVQWCTAQTNTASDGTTVPERIDGFYLQIDTNARQDIGKATSLGTSTVTNRDAWQYTVASGTPKGSHTAAIQPYSYVLDPNTGQPTSARQDGGVMSVPFTAVDPVYNMPPQAPTGGRITK